jgi:hypothetical protein
MQSKFRLMLSLILLVYLVSFSIHIAIDSVRERDKLIERQKNRQQLTHTIIIMTSTCLFLMWAITYIAQMNPLVTPQEM